MPAPLISLALHRSRPLVHRQMAGMMPSDLLMKRAAPAPRVGVVGPAPRLVTDDELPAHLKHFYDKRRVSRGSPRLRAAAPAMVGSSSRTFWCARLSCLPREPPPAALPPPAPTPRSVRAQDQAYSELKAVSPTTKAPSDKIVMRYLNEEGRAFAERRHWGRGCTRLSRRPARRPALLTARRLRRARVGEEQREAGR